MPEFAGLSDPDLRLDSAYDPAALVIEGWFDPDIIPGTLPISATSGGADEALQGLAKTASEPVDAEAGVGIVTQTAGLPFEATQAIAKTSGYVASSVQGIAKTAGLVWSAAQGIAATVAERIEALAAVITTNPPALRGAATTSAGINVTSRTLNAPTGLTDGDLVFICITCGSGPGVVTPPPGFVEVARSADNQCRLYSKTADGEGATFTISWTATILVATTCIAYSNAEEVDDFVVTLDAGSQTSHPTGTITALLPNEGFVIFCGLEGSNVGIDPAGGFTERSDTGTGGGGPRQEVQDMLAQNDPGDKGPYTPGSGLVTRCNFVCLVGIKPRNRPVAQEPVDSNFAGVAATVGAPYEAVSGIRATSVGPKESLRGIAATVVERWESLGQDVRAILGFPIEALRGITSTKSEPWETQEEAVQQSESEPWESLQGIAATKSEPLESGAGLTPTSAQASVPIEAEQGISTTAGEPWETPSSSVQQTGSAPWESDVSVAAATSEVVEALAGIAASVLEPWESSAAASHAVSQAASLPIDAGSRFAKVGGVSPWEALQKIRATVAGMRWEAVAPLVTQTARVVVEALRKIAATRSEPWDAAGATLAVAVSLPVEGGQKIVATVVEPWEALQGVFNVAPDPHDNPGPVFNNSFMPTESLVRVRASETGPYEATQKIARTVAEQIEASGVLRKLGGLPLEALAPGVAQTASAPFEVLIGERQFVALPLDVGGGVAAVAVLPIHAEGHVDAIGFAVGIVIAATDASDETIAGSSSKIGDVPATEASDATVAAAMAAARVIAASLSTIEDKEAGQP